MFYTILEGGKNKMASTLRGRGAKRNNKIHNIKEIEKMVEKTPEEVVRTYRELVACLNEGLPRATSGEVLNSRVNW
jgi:hypothetical protein